MSISSDLDDISSSDVEANPATIAPLNNLDLDQDVRRRLSLHLRGIEAGNREVYVTPLCRSIPPSSILGLWDHIFKSKSNSMNSVLLDLEANNRAKFGPRSLALPWSERAHNVAKYFEGRTKPYQMKTGPTPLDDYLPNSFSLRPLSIDNAISYLKNSTNSGLPYYTRKSKVKDRLTAKFDELLDRKDPCILFTRTQENEKTRDVWGFPIADTLEEMRFYQPLLSYQKKLAWRSALRGPEEVNRDITSIIDYSIRNDLKLISIDFSSFDSSVPQDLIDMSFKYVMSLFQPKYWDEIMSVCDRFSTIGLLTPSGVLDGPHGVPSGSTFTNEVDSLAQYFASLHSGVTNPSKVQIQGDDGVYCVNESDVSTLFKSFSSFGLSVNTDKSYVSSDYCVYLQNLYHTDYRGENNVIGGIYPVYRALNRIIYQERWSNFEDFGLTGMDYYSIRTISILENVKHHPLFKEFVTFIYGLDKYSLGYTQEGLNKYCDMLIKGPGTGGVLQNQYGDDIRGISSFETVKIIRELA
jgi:hypothetical protein